MQLLLHQPMHRIMTRAFRARLKPPRSTMPGDATPRASTRPASSVAEGPRSLCRLKTGSVVDLPGLRLLDLQVVVNSLHAVDLAREFRRPGLLIRTLDDAGQVDDPALGVDVHAREVRHAITRQLALDCRRDGAVAHRLACRLPGRGLARDTRQQ